MKYSSLAFLAAVGLLAGCGGSSSPLSPASNNGYFRFVNGSADAGAVDVYVDGKLLQSNVSYGMITNYNAYAPGAHTIAIDATGTSTAIAGVSSTVLAQSVNGGQYVSLVLVGEEHPTVSTDTPNLLAFNDQLYDTPSGGAAVNFHNAAPVTATGATQFSISDTSGTQALGTAVNIGGETAPAGVPGSFINVNLPVTFTATPSNTAITAATLQPGMVSATSCAANTLPCNSNNLSVYFIDGPAASSAPSSTTLPSGVSSSQKASLVGIFDANGT